MNGTILVATVGGLVDAATSTVLAFDGRSVDALSPDAHWAIVDGRELWARSDEWSKVATAERWDLTCVLSLGEGALVGTAEAHLLEVSGHTLEPVEPFEAVPGREDWFTPWGGPPDVRTMTQLQSRIYVNVHVGGIVRGDGRSRWEPTMDISADVHEVKTIDDVLIAASAVGLAQSNDAGNSWAFDDRGLHATYARAVAATSRYIYMSVAHGPRGGDAAIYRKPRDGSEDFSRCDLPSFPDNIDTGCLDASEDFVACATLAGDLYTSTDDGVSWEKVASGLPRVRGIVIH